MNTINLLIVDRYDHVEDIDPIAAGRQGGREQRAEIRLSWTAAPQGRLDARWLADG